MKVLLINPPYSRLRGTKECTEMVTPLGLSYIAAYLRGRGHEARIYDANYNPDERLPRFHGAADLIDSFERYRENVDGGAHPVWDECRERIEAFGPDVVGLTMLSPVRGAARRCVWRGYAGISTRDPRSDRSGDTILDLGTPYLSLVIIF